MKKIGCLILAVMLSCGCADWLFVKKAQTGKDLGMKEVAKGNTLYRKGCYAESLDRYLKAHEIFTAYDRMDGVAMSLNNIGNVYRATGKVDSALLFYDQAYSTYKGMNDQNGMIQSLSNKAAALIASGRYDEAQEVLDAAGSMPDGKSFTPLFTNRGLLLIKTGRLEEAQAVLEKALDQADANEAAAYAALHFVLGGLMADTGHYEKALKYSQTALVIDKKNGFHKGIADDLNQIGSAYMALENYDAAVNAFERSIKVYALLDSREEIEPLLLKLTEAAQKAGVDITITTHFVRQWLEGQVSMPPCE
jgi:tetratricopeptide (TPR) repeat protein